MYIRFYIVLFLFFFVQIKSPIDLTLFIYERWNATLGKRCVTCRVALKAVSYTINCKRHANIFYKFNFTLGKHLIQTNYCVFTFTWANEVGWLSRRWWNTLDVFPPFTAFFFTPCLSCWKTVVHDDTLVISSVAKKIAHARGGNYSSSRLSTATCTDQKQSNTQVLCNFVISPFEFHLTIVPAYYRLTVLIKRSD